MKKGVMQSAGSYLPPGPPASWAHQKTPKTFDRPKSTIQSENYHEHRTAILNKEVSSMDACEIFRAGHGSDFRCGVER